MGFHRKRALGQKQYTNYYKYVYEKTYDYLYSKYSINYADNILLNIKSLEVTFDLDF